MLFTTFWLLLFECKLIVGSSSSLCMLRSTKYWAECHIKSLLQDCEKKVGKVNHDSWRWFRCSYATINVCIFATFLATLIIARRLWARNKTKNCKTMTNNKIHLFCKALYKIHDVKCKRLWLHLPRLEDVRVAWFISCVCI